MFTAHFLKASPWAFRAVVFVLVTSLAGCSSKEDPPEEVEPAEADCERDDQNSPGEAAPLGESATGFICPADDADWYELNVPDGDQLVSIDLSMTVALSPVQITYSIFELDSAGEPTQAIAQPPSSEVDVGRSLSISHCIDPGDYLLVVRDQGNNDSDNRNPYELGVATQPDPDTSEPNNDQANATALTGPATGYIACRGDEDWYSITVPEQNRLVVNLSSPTAEYEPQVRIVDAEGNVLAIDENQASATRATDIELTQVLPGAGTFYVVVSDNDGADADPAVPYELSVEGIQDIDPNEPNDTPETATPISGTPVSCASGESFSFTGSIGAPGDNDWFRIPLSGCEDGIIEADVEFDVSGMTAQQQWELASQVQASVTLVRPHDESPCSDRTECNALQLACDQPLDCAGYFETCLGQGLCAGASVCLPEGMCGANQTQRRYDCPSRFSECQPGDTPPRANAASLSSPIFGDDFLYLRVSDFQADGFAPDRLYTLNVRVLEDSDPNEPNNLPVNVVSPEFSRSALSQNATPITVRDCTAGDCCSGDEVSGQIAYDSDVDWFRFPHPCPEEDCTLRMVWSTDAGPTDLNIAVYREGGGNWAPARQPDQRDVQSADSGSIGGTAASDSCFYAFQGHGESGYLVEVRDRFSLFSDDATVVPESRDWSASQSYSFCVEKVSNVCEEPPCQIYPNGCGQPM